MLRKFYADSRRFRVVLWADIHWLAKHKRRADNPKQFFPKFGPGFQRFFQWRSGMFSGVLTIIRPEYTEGPLPWC
jgi:hypothetical protein